MNGRNRVLRNTLLGVMLAASMIVGLTALKPFAQPSAATLPPEDARKAPMVEGEAANKSLTTRATPQEKVSTSTDESKFAAVDPVRLGAPFTIAVLTGFVVYMMVKRKVD